MFNSKTIKVIQIEHKKISSLFAVVLFAGSLMSVAPALEDNTVSCTDVAFDTQDKMQKKDIV